MPQKQLLKGQRSAALLILAALAPLALFATILSVLAINWQGRSMEAEAQSQAHLLRLSIDRYIDSNFTGLLLLAGSPRLDPARTDLAAFHEIVSRSVTEVGAWDQVILLDRQGQQLVNTIAPFGTELPRVVEPESFEEILKTGQPVVSALSEKGNFITRSRRIAFRVPVIRNGEMRFVLTGVFKPERFASLIDLPEVKPGWRPFLADSKGRLVSAPRSPDAVPGRELQKGGLEARRQRQFGSYTSRTTQGEPTVTLFSKSATSGWSAHIAIPESIFTAPMRRFQILLGSAGILTLTSTALFIWLLKRESESRAQAITETEHARRLEALGRVAGGVAHDFNNLLTAILGSLQSLRRGQRSGERADRLLETAIMAAERGSALTQRLLSFSRKQQLRAEPVSVAQAFGAVERLFAHAAESFTFDVHVADGVDGIMVDRSQFEATLLNLCANARDAMPSGGTLTLTARPERIAATGVGSLSPGDYVQVRITDTGAGMDERTAQRALEPFFSTKGSRGTGLGLSTALAFAVQSNGDLTLSSAPGKGTTVMLRLPAADVTIADVAETTSPHDALQVLVVDDDPLVLLGTRAMLEEQNYRVTSARSGSEALELLAREAVDVVVTDFRMPGMSGLELAQSISRQWPQLPVIIYSGYAELIASNIAYPIISKPASAEVLARAIDGVRPRSSGDQT